jgi:hypothetical protein
MEIINRYFGKIIFVKTDRREEHTVYVAALSSAFQDGRKQYALAFVPIHLAIISQGYLSDLHWVNLQTRTLTNGYKMPPQRWEIPKSLDNPMFTVVERSENKTKYLSDQYPLEMVLIHDPKKKTKYQYHSHMNMLAALTTFKCVISLLDHPSPDRSQPPSPPQPSPAPGVPRFSSGAMARGGLPPMSAGPGYSPSAGMSPIIPPSPSPGPTLTGPPPGGSYRSVEADGGKYTNIGLPDYTVPQIPTAPQKKGEVRREMISQPRPSVPHQGPPGSYVPREDTLHNKQGTGREEKQ